MVRPRPVRGRDRWWLFTTGLSKDDDGRVQRVGSAIGIGAFAGNLSGMAMIEFAGWSLDNGHGYLPMFLICSLTYLAALAAIQLILPRVVAIDEDADDGTAAPVVAH